MGPIRKAIYTNYFLFTLQMVLLEDFLNKSGSAEGV